MRIRIIGENKNFSHSLILGRHVPLGTSSKHMQSYVCVCLLYAVSCRCQWRMSESHRSLRRPLSSSEDAKQPLESCVLSRDANDYSARVGTPTNDHCTQAHCVAPQPYTFINACTDLREQLKILFSILCRLSSSDSWFVCWFFSIFRFLKWRHSWDRTCWGLEQEQQQQQSWKNK